MIKLNNNKMKKQGNDISNIPPLPGVYIFKAKGDNVLYIGKAKNLKNRLKSYFNNTSSLDNRKLSMMKLVKDFNWIVTESELEALILESNLIKQHKPRFNIILRDDKSYPYLKITMNEKWPKVEVTRRLSNDGAIYFGPYAPAQAMWEALSIIRRHFLIRKCRHSLDKPMRPCIQHQMKRCLAPCAGFITQEQYLSHVEDVRLFLNGESSKLLNSYKEKMNNYAEQLMFEEAGQMRDKIQRLSRALEQQKVISPELGDLDVIGWDIDEGLKHIVFNILFVRKGLLIGAKNYLFQRLPSSCLDEIVEDFVQSFYSKDMLPPPLVIVQSTFEDIDNHIKWLQIKRKDNVDIRTPIGNKEQELLLMAKENAKIYRMSKLEKSHIDVIHQLKERLKLNRTPYTIGAFDISNISGTNPTGAFIYWAEGDFKKDLYRKVKIQSVKGIDDFKMMEETIERVIKKLRDEEIPPLILIDGGKGHLEVGLRTVPVSYTHLT
ncbi:MAG: excinuclease ABC subunit UvrC, partial [Thermodesulfovibrionales bacterium]|nr:excinuclease ABC subunit UvrC [Thermodesulfovibrionales bacterium]